MKYPELNPNPETIFLIAMDFWNSNGRTNAQIETVLNSGDEQLITKFLAPAAEIYKKTINLLLEEGEVK